MGGNEMIRKITPSGVVTTLAGAPYSGIDAGVPPLPPPGPFNNDGAGVAAQFNSPSGIAVDASGTVFVADTGNNSVRRITPDGTVTTLAGNQTVQFGNQDGTGPTALFNAPAGIAVDAKGNLFVVDGGQQHGSRWSLWCCTGVSKRARILCATLVTNGHFWQHSRVSGLFSHDARAHVSVVFQWDRNSRGDPGDPRDH